MAKSKQTIEALMAECASLGLPISTNKDGLTQILQSYYLSIDPRRQEFGLGFVMKLASPALCKQIQQVPEKQRQPFVEGTCDLDRYLVEEKYDGVRMLVTYRRSEGLDFYTRSISDVNYLPISYKENLIVDASLIDDALEDFVIDCELVANRSIGDEALLHSVTGLLSNLPEEAQRKQRENPHMLKFMVFDCLQCNGVRVLEKPLAERRDFIAQVLQHLDPRMFCQSPAIVGMQPRDAFREFTERGCEGIVIKDLTLPYDITGSRTKSGWVKWKRAVDPVDCFVSGFDASEVKSRKGMVAALHFSVIDENGEERHIASCSNFDMGIRADMSAVDDEGNVFLRDHWYGRVAEITGLAFSTVNYRFVHAVIRGWRPDRSWQTCKVNSEVLKKYRL